MNTPARFPPIRQLLDRLGIRLEKRRSQHFLREQQRCADIAALAGLTRDHTVVEVGAGLGNLTVELSARAGRVIAIEMDDSFAEWHDYVALHYPPIEFVYTDVLEWPLDGELATVEGPVVGVGNLPYQVTSEVLFQFVDARRTFERLVFMVQKEVAERIAAGAGKRSAGALTYKVAMRYVATIALEIGAGEFLPPPKVESAVLVLEPRPAPLYSSEAERRAVYTLLDGLFTYRRKTLANGLLLSGRARGREEAERVLARAGVDGGRRPETLQLDEVLALARALEAGHG